MMPENNALCWDVSIDTLPESILIDWAKGDTKRVNALSLVLGSLASCERKRSRAPLEISPASRHFGV